MPKMPKTDRPQLAKRQGPNMQLPEAKRQRPEAKRLAQEPSKKSTLQWRTPVAKRHEQNLMMRHGPVAKRREQNLMMRHDPVAKRQ